MSGDLTPIIRPATARDLPFLREMLFEAAAPEPEDPVQDLEGVLALPTVASYVDGWGRAGDLGVIAEVSDRPMGAAWCRIPGEVHGWGYIADDVPEVAIAVVEDRRGEGIGRALLAALIRAARTTGFPALSLSTDPGDAVAVRLYTVAGFRQVGVNDELIVMRLDL